MKGGLALEEDKVADAIGPGHPIVPGKADESDLYLMVALAETHDPMPPKGDTVSASDLRKIKAWIDDGAPVPGQEAAVLEKVVPKLPTGILGWTNTSGQKMKASFVQVRGTDAVFRMENGKTTNYPLEKLSKESQDEVKKLTSPTPAQVVPAPATAADPEE